jgi:zinc and cadmium transporter
MDGTELRLATYCALVVAASVAGGLLPALLRLTHRRLEIALSFVSGVMLGVALLHLLPHALLEQAAHDPAGGLAHAQIERVLQWLLAGFLAMFLLERAFAFHHHEIPGAAPVAHACDARGRSRHHHVVTWTGAAIGLAAHGVTEGVALAASLASAAHGTAHAEAGASGLATFAVILLHKPFDSITIGTLMAAGSQPARRRHAVNALFALAVPAGAMLFELGFFSSQGSGLVIAAALAFSAGTFLCISLSDLLPELQFHRHDRGVLTVALVLGLAVAWAVSWAEGRWGHADHARRPVPRLLDPPEPIVTLAADRLRRGGADFVHRGPAQGGGRSALP